MPYSRVTKALDWTALVCAALLAAMKIAQMAGRKTRAGPFLTKTLVADVATIVFLLGITIRNVIKHKSWEM